MCGFLKGCFWKASLIVVNLKVNMYFDSVVKGLSGDNPDNSVHEMHR